MQVQMRVQMQMQTKVDAEDEMLIVQMQTHPEMHTQTQMQTDMPKRPRCTCHMPRPRPSCSFFRRVCTLPRKLTHLNDGLIAYSCACLASAERNARHEQANSWSWLYLGACEAARVEAPGRATHARQCMPWLCGGSVGRASAPSSCRCMNDAARAATRASHEQPIEASRRPSAYYLRRPHGSTLVSHGVAAQRCLAHVQMWHVQPRVHYLLITAGTLAAHFWPH